MAGGTSDPLVSPVCWLLCPDPPALPVGAALGAAAAAGAALAALMPLLRRRWLCATRLALQLLRPASKSSMCWMREHCWQNLQGGVGKCMMCWVSWDIVLWCVGAGRGIWTSDRLG
jgi:hypothetical protein